MEHSEEDDDQCLLLVGVFVTTVFVFLLLRQWTPDLSCSSESLVEFVAECGDTTDSRTGRQPIVYCLE